MLEKLEQLIEEEQWEEARKLELEMEAYQEPSDRFSILNAMIYMQEGDYEAALKCVTVGLLLNPGNYELYYLLGNYYLAVNPNQAFLCYEQAREYCEDKENQKVLEESMAFLREMEDFQTAPFVICQYDLSENLFSNMQKTLQMADADSDILILRSDSVVPQNAVFWLRMGLYEKESVGAVGPLSNTSMNEQALAVSFQSMEEYLQVAGSLQIPSCYAYENKVYLEDSAVLIKRKAWDQAGGFLQDYHSPVAQIADLCIRLNRNDFECRLCTNSFVYAKKEHTAAEYQTAGWAEFTRQLSFNLFYYSGIRTELIEKIQEEPDACFSVLEIGCGCGTTLSHIKWKYPNARVCGVELSEQAAALGKHMADIIVGDVETLELPYGEQTFDYIICGDVLEHLRDPEKVVAQLKRYLCANGKLIACIPNLANITVITPLLHGTFEYKDAGLLDRTHIHFFTKKSIEKMFLANGYRITEWIPQKGGEAADLVQGDDALIQLIYQLPGIASQEELETYEYLVVAER